MEIMAFLISVSVVLCATVLGFLLHTERTSFADAISFTVVLLVVSVPMAMEVVTTSTMAIGSRVLSRAGVIVARLSSIEELAGMNMLCSDKTGTLTLNKMVIQDEAPIFVQEGLTQADLLRFAALATKWHEPPKDAVDTLVLGAVDIASLHHYEAVDYLPFDPAVKRTESTVRDTTSGAVFKTTKGAPHIIAALAPDSPAAAQLHTHVEQFAERGIRCLAVARGAADGSDAWTLLGLLTFLDPPRPDTKVTLQRCMGNGVAVKMITGDHVAIAKETARQLGIGTNILNAERLPNLNAKGKAPKDLDKYVPQILGADGFAQVFPEHKFLIVEALRQAGYAVGMTGDGVNDAPALKRADIGIAVQGATDAARAAADIVLTQPGLAVVVDAIAIARGIFRCVRIMGNSAARLRFANRAIQWFCNPPAACRTSSCTAWPARCSCSSSSSSPSSPSSRPSTRWACAARTAARTWRWASSAATAAPAARWSCGAPTPALSEPGAWLRSTAAWAHTAWASQPHSCWRRRPALRATTWRTALWSTPQQTPSPAACASSSGRAPSSSR
jgi:H+-transporting ATPase